MTEIAGYLTSIPWWFTAVVVAIIVNLISSYLRDGTDWVWRYAKRKLNSHDASDVRVKRVAESNAAFIDQLKTDESLRRFLVEAEVRARLLSLELLVVGFWCCSLGYFLIAHPQQLVPSFVAPATLLMSLLAANFGMQQFLLAYGLSRALIEVERSRRPEKPVS